MTTIRSILFYDARNNTNEKEQMMCDDRWKWIHFEHEHSWIWTLDDVYVCICEKTGEHLCYCIWMYTNVLYFDVPKVKA